MLYALDIETECAVKDCTEKAMHEHGLIPHLSRITCIGLWSPNKQLVFREEPRVQLGNWLMEQAGDPIELTGHNLKFDLKKLVFDGLQINTNIWTDDSQLMASICLDKVSSEYLEWYEVRRKLENKKLKKGFSHREARGNSLKVLAPYFLGIQPFWETPENHNNDEYVLKDCEYSYELTEFFIERLQKQKLYSFYKEKLLPITKMLLESELKGIFIDIRKLKGYQKRSENKVIGLKTELDENWELAYKSYFISEKTKLKKQYNDLEFKAIEKIRNLTINKTLKISTRYKELYEKSLKKLPNKMNLDSPKQLSWILKDYYGFDIQNFLNKDSTGKDVLQRLAQTNRQDIVTFLEYRKEQKLITSFFPSYLELQNQGFISCSFNPTGTRTGRLSSSNPNLQQVPSDLHEIFMAREGYLLASYDMTAIEAKLIAYYTEDPILIDVVNSGKDFHGFNAKIYCNLDCDPLEVKENFPKERKLAKEIGYALFYGAGANRLEAVSQKHGFNWTLKQCREKVENFKETYKTVFEIKAKFDEYALNNPLENYFGRQHSYPDPTEIYMKAFNTLIQSSASDLVLNSAYKIVKEFKVCNIDGFPLLYIHDEIVTEFKEEQKEKAIEIIEKAMTNYDLGIIKLQVEGKVAKEWKK